LQAFSRAGTLLLCCWYLLLMLKAMNAFTIRFLSYPNLYAYKV
jgi:hypothetical protein